MTQQYVNVVIINSIKISKACKRYFVKRYENLVLHNGAGYASAKFKLLKETLLEYRSRNKRIHKLDVYLRRSGFRCNGWLRMLFKYMDTQPEQCLNFVKLYCNLQEPTMSVNQAVEIQHAELEKANSTVSTSIPGVLEEWVSMIKRPMETFDQFNYQKLILKHHPASEYMDCIHKYKTYEEYRDYIQKWRRIFGIAERGNPTFFVDRDSSIAAIGKYLPRPEMYKDCTGTGDHMQSNSLEDDYANVMQMIFNAKFGLSALSQDSINFLEQYVLKRDTSPDDYIGSDNYCFDFNEGLCVGNIRHIPKNGTTDRRSIADPNKVLQCCCAPIDNHLSMILRKMGSDAQDCTYDQTRLNSWIVHRVSNENLYAGSVDLHHATDYLPFSWMEYIFNNLISNCCNDVEYGSWHVFLDIARGQWKNGKYLDSWKVGQPLGVLPSFRCLGISHNIIVESLAAARGLLHSPYAVLGDDIVIMNKNLRKQYIKLMNNVGVPLSLHKSYSRNLVEFAGQTFIKNLAPFYTTDQNAITWNNLFDYQLATGIKIPYKHLPQYLQKKISKLCACKSGSILEKIYDLAYSYLMRPRGSSGFPLALTELPWSKMAFAMEDIPEKEDIAPLPWSGITNFSGHPVVYLDYRYAIKDGYFMRFRRTVDWYRDKYRPCSTDKVLLAASTCYLTDDDNREVKLG